MELVKLNASEFGLEESKAVQISAQFKPMLDKMEELEKEYNEVVKLDIEEPETAAKAKELRLKYVKVRTGTAAIHKEQKAFYLAGGKYVDGWKNAQLFASQGIEDKLMSIEKHAETLENERIEKIQNERIEACKKFVQDEIEILSNLGTLPDSVWDNYIKGLEVSYNARIEAEKKAEAERLENERIEKLHIERKEAIYKFWDFIPANYKNDNFGKLTDSEWNERFEWTVNEKKKHDKEQEEIAAENLKLKKEAEKKEKEAAELKAKQDAIIAKQKAESEAKLKAEKAKADKLAAELKAKQDEEKAILERLEKEKEEKLAAEKQAALAPEKDKITNWIDSFELNAIDSSEFSMSGQATVNTIKQKFEAFKNWANDQKENIK